jgi:NodT family efflux transporter outer membrane factor (OMF) lipoprotein
VSAKAWHRLGTRLPALALIGLAGCAAVGPDYVRPKLDAPAQWQTEPGWQSGQPRDADLKDNWWEMYGDAQLNGLIQTALAQNNNLAMAQARLDQARAQTASALSNFSPKVGLQAGSSRFRTSADRPLSNYAVTNTSVEQTDYNAGLTVSYEVDLAGRVRRTLEGAKASEAQSKADFENTRLVLVAQLASNYLALRELDAEMAVLEKTLKAQQKTLDLVNTRHDLGNASALDVEQQRSLLAGTDSQYQGLRDTRARFEHALATLTGQAAPGFTVPASAQLPEVPALPLNRPADLLERRPDVASAERAMAAANAQIGVARSAYFPTLMLSGLYGDDSNGFAKLFSAPSLLWTLGMAATQTLFDGGRINAAVAGAQGAYQQTAANYRQTVLVAFQEVQDSLSTQAALKQAEASLNTASNSAKRVLSLSEARYQAGAASLLEVVLSEQTLLNYQRQAVQNRGQQLLTSVQMVKALGGGWHAPGSSDAPSAPASK